MRYSNRKQVPAQHAATKDRERRIAEHCRKGLNDEEIATAMDMKVTSIKRIRELLMAEGALDA